MKTPMLFLFLTMACCSARANAAEKNSPKSHQVAGRLKTSLTAIWANNGQDKVAREELRATSDPASVLNSVWDGTSVNLFAARNEVVSFVLILESASATAQGLSVTLDALVGPSGTQLKTQGVTGDGVFDWRDRQIELFFVRYLQIRGLSLLSYENYYDERHVPERFRRPWSGDGDAQPGSTWEDRPDHDRFYPEIAVPIELVGEFEIEAGQSQCIWVDIFVPPASPVGRYTGTIDVHQTGAATREIPVVLTAENVQLDDARVAKTMLYLGYADINNRYVGVGYPDTGTAEHATARLVRDRHAQLAHRHRISMIGEVHSTDLDQPDEEWLPRLDGSLYMPERGYEGPGQGLGEGVFSVGTYGSWSWQDEGEQAMRRHADGWVNWFQANAPDTEFFLYLIDESDDFEQIEQWCTWIENNPGPGSALPSFATIALTDAMQHTPALDIAASWSPIGITRQWEEALAFFVDDPEKQAHLYNGQRPATGTFATEDDGVALRVLAWTQFKKHIDRWFFWESTYYNNFQVGGGETNVFRSAKTFGDFDRVDPVAGETGFNYSNGDGVLFYPGTDLVYPEESYGVLGPFVSLRMKLWRRGIQDVMLLNQARAVDPDAVDALVDQMIPKVLWEYGVASEEDPTWVLTDISWSTESDDWEAARRQLMNILLGGPAANPDTRWMPHLTRADGLFQTLLTFTNTSETRQQVTLTPYLEDGQAVDGQMVALDGSAFVVRTVDDLFGRKDISHFSISGSHDIVVTAAYCLASGEGATAHVNDPSIDLQQAGAPYIVYPGEWDRVFDGLAIVNRGTGTGILRGSLVDANGNTTFTTVLDDAIAPMAKALVVFDSVLPDASQRQIRITCDQPSVAVFLRGTPPGIHPGTLYQTLPISPADGY